MIKRLFVVAAFLLASVSTFAELKISSPVMANGGTLPEGLKCTRDGGDGLSPPIDWSGAPEGTKSFAVVMHHYPANRVEGVDNPSHYWLVWNIPANTATFPRGNPESIGNEGGDKDKRYVGYTPPCSPGNVSHKYTITVYALDTDSISLGKEDDINVDWVGLMGSIKEHVIEESALDFMN